MLLKVGKVAVGDMVQMPGQLLDPARGGIFSMTVLDVDVNGSSVRLTFQNKTRTIWLNDSMELQRAYCDLSKAPIAANREQSKMVGGKGIE